MKNGRNAALNGGRGSGQTAKRISEIYEDKIADLKANFDYVLEGKDLEVKQLGERCNQLLKDKGDLTDKLDSLIQYNDELCDSVEKQSFEICTLENKVTELKQQIEKMKADVKHEQSYWNSCEMQYGLFQRLLDKWEIKENG